MTNHINGLDEAYMGKRGMGPCQVEGCMEWSSWGLVTPPTATWTHASPTDNFHQMPVATVDSYHHHLRC